MVAAAYDLDRDLGGFILVDKRANNTAALGMVIAPEPQAAASTQETAPAPIPAAPPEVVRDWHWRSLAKAASWRAIGSVDTFVLSWIFTGEVKTAGSIAATEVFTKIGL